MYKKVVWCAAGETRYFARIGKIAFNAINIVKSAMGDISVLNYLKSHYE